MSRPLRVAYAGALYHLCSRGVGRRAIFEADADRRSFVDLLAATAARFDVALHAWVLMGNHFHLLATTRRPNLPRWMHALLGAYTVAFQRRHHRVGYEEFTLFPSFPNSVWECPTPPNPVWP